MGLIRVDRHFFYASSDESVIREISKLNPMPQRITNGGRHMTVLVDDKDARFIQLTRSFLTLMLRKSCRPAFGRTTELLECSSYERNGNILTMRYLGKIVASIDVETGDVVMGKKDFAFRKLVKDSFFDGEKHVLEEWGSLEGLVEDIEDINETRTFDSSTPLLERVINKAIIATREQLVKIADRLFATIVVTEWGAFLKVVSEVFKSKPDRAEELDYSGILFELKSESGGKKEAMHALLGELAFLKADHLRLKSGAQPENEMCVTILSCIIDEYVAIRGASEKEFALLLNSPPHRALF